VLKKCVNISILDFKLFNDKEDFYSCFHFREDTRHTLYTDKIEFHIVELPKLPTELKENSSDRLLWAKFISAERKEELEMIANQNSYIGSAFQQLEIISQDKQKRMEYEAREKAIRDYNQGILEAELRGEKCGEEKISNLINKLITDKRTDDIPKITNNQSYRQQLYKEYNIE